jgi:hypothetical protein
MSEPSSSRELVGLWPADAWLLPSVPALVSELTCMNCTNTYRSLF